MEFIDGLVDQLILPGTHPAVFWIFVVTGMVIQGIGKSGFAGGVGILTFPLLCLVMRVEKVAAIMLPMLCLFDLNAIYHFRVQKDLAKLARLVPFLLIGIAAGSVFWFAAGADDVIRYETPLKIFVGAIAILFAVYILARDRILKYMEGYTPGPAMMAAAGISAGITSTIAHAAGPIVGFYMYVQGMNKSLFVGTTAWTFTFINFAKLPTYTFAGLFDRTNLEMALILLPLVPIGSFIGKWLHDRISEALFNMVIMICVLVAGIQLVSGTNILLWAFGR